MIHLRLIAFTLACMLTLAAGVFGFVAAEPVLPSAPQVTEAATTEALQTPPQSEAMESNTTTPSAAIVSRDATLAITPKTRLVINIPSRTLWLYRGDTIVRYFPVGLGRVGFPTPVGTYRIIRKVEDPAWENPYLGAGKMRIAPGRKNPLGTRWMGFLKNAKGEFGIHGTNRPQSVGRFSSHGCVRMRITDAETLFELIDIGTPLEVQYETVLIRPTKTAMRLVVFSDRFHRGKPSVSAMRQKILAQYPDAQLDDDLIRQALATPSERFQTVGTLVPPPAVPSSDAQEKTISPVG